MLRSDIQRQIDDGYAYRPQDTFDVGCDWCGSVKNADEDMVCLPDTEDGKYETAYLCKFSCADELVDA